MTRSSRLMVVVMLVAIALRVWGIGFGLPAASARPDETQIAGPAVGYLSGDLRPPFFQWPALFQYTVALAYALYAFVGRPLTGFTSLAAFAESRRQSLAPFFYISRSLSMLCGVATVWLVYRVGRRLFDETVGVVAALFIAVAFLHVRDSHFGVSDVPMTAFLVAAVLLILRWQEHGGVGRAAAAGLVGGLAGSMKYNALGVGVPFAVAWTIRLAEHRREGTRPVGRLLVELVAYGGALLVGFLGTSPYVLIDWSRFLADTSEVQATLAHGTGIVVGQGWWYFGRVVLPAALGWPMFLLGVAGAAALLVTEWRKAVVLLAFPAAYYAVAGRGYGVFARHMLPVVPFLCLTAAWATVRVAQAVASITGPSVLRPVSGALAILVALTPAYKSVMLDRLLSTTDNRVVVGRALIALIPPGASFYQTGETYGHAPIGIDGRTLDIKMVRYDATASAFQPGAPEWVLVQRSPLRYYSAVPAALEKTLAEEYLLERSFLTGAESDSNRVYDQQDAFYLPLAGLEGIRRPGPSFELYRRR